MDTNETQLALNAILSTAASMGIDVDLLCHAAAEEYFILIFQTLRNDS